MTIREIASITNISPSTVYRILKNPYSAKSELLQKIHQATQGDPFINSLKKVYIVIPFLNEFYTHFLIHCIELLSKQGIQIIPHIYHEDPKQEEEFLSSIILSPSIGLLWAPHNNKNSYPFLRRKKFKVPIVSLFRQIEDLGIELQIVQDNEQAMKIILQHLAYEDKKNVLLINGDPYLSTAKQRSMYFEKHINSYPHIKGDIITVDFDNWQNIYDILLQQKEFLENCDSIITTSEDICFAVLKLLKETRGLESMLKLKIFSLDYSPMLEILGISMVYFCPKLAAEKTIDLLLKKTNTPDLALSYFLPPNIII